MLKLGVQPPSDKASTKGTEMRSTGAPTREYKQPRVESTITLTTSRRHDNSAENLDM